MYDLYILTIQGRMKGFLYTVVLSTNSIGYLIDVVLVLTNSSVHALEGFVESSSSVYFHYITV